MLNKKYILLVLLISICLVSAVSATDADNIDEIASNDDVEIVNDNAIASANDGDTIILSGEYVGSGSEIQISKDMTFVGKDNATLDAKGLSGIFVNTGKTVLFENIKFVNGNSAQGGALYKCNAKNCVFQDCSASDEGGAMYLGLADKCTFIKCSAKKGGALYDCTANDCIFNECSASYEGGAMCQGKANNCTFNNCNYNAQTLSEVTFDSKCVINDFEDVEEEDEYGVVRIHADDLKVYYNSGKYYKAVITISPSEYGEYMPVVFKINGKKVASVKTSEYGVAKFKITQKPGTYKVRIELSGAYAEYKITVKHAISLKTVKVKKSAKKLVLKATLKKVNSKSVKNKKIVFKFKGKKYTARTDKKGVAKVTIKKKVLKKLKVGKKVTYQATYLKDTVKKTVKIKK